MGQGNGSPRGSKRTLKDIGVDECINLLLEGQGDSNASGEESRRAKCRERPSVRKLQLLGSNRLSKENQLATDTQVVFKEIHRSPSLTLQPANSTLNTESPPDPQSRRLFYRTPPPSPYSPQTIKSQSPRTVSTIIVPPEEPLAYVSIASTLPQSPRPQSFDVDTQVYNVDTDSDSNPYHGDWSMHETKIASLEAQIEELYEGMDSYRKEEGDKDAQYLRIIAQAAKLEAKSAADKKKWRSERFLYELSMHDMLETIKSLESDLEIMSAMKGLPASGLVPVDGPPLRFTGEIATIEMATFSESEAEEHLIDKESKDEEPSRRFRRERKCLKLRVGRLGMLGRNIQIKFDGMRMTGTRFMTRGIV